MKKRIGYGVLILISLMENDAGAQKLTLLKKTALPHYPSASAIEYYNNKLYVIGDDATQLLVLTNEHRAIDSVSFTKSAGRRVSKDKKADLESLTIISQNNQPHLLAVSSFSTSNRTYIYTFPIHNPKLIRQEKEKRVPSALKKAGIKNVNIEGSATINNQLIISNRANGGNKQNQLLVISFDKSGQEISSHHMIELGLPLAKGVVGISGLAYLPEKDLLLFTASTEDTDNAYADGAIGESYLGFIANISQKLKTRSITADKVLPLTAVLKSGAQKVESVCIESSQNKELILHLAADNDNGESVLFKIRMQL